MCPQRFVPHSYDAAKLAVLQQVFEDTWAQVVREHPNREPSRDEEIRTELAREIVAYASTGISDPEGSADGPLRACKTSAYSDSVAPWQCNLRTSKCGRLVSLLRSTFSRSRATIPTSDS
jgi:hypothetical protein